MRTTGRAGPGTYRARSVGRQWPGRCTTRAQPEKTGSGRTGQTTNGVMTTAAPRTATRLAAGTERSPASRTQRRERAQTEEQRPTSPSPAGRTRSPRNLTAKPPTGHRRTDRGGRADPIAPAPRQGNPSSTRHANSEHRRRPRRAGVLIAGPHICDEDGASARTGRAAGGRAPGRQGAGGRFSRARGWYRRPLPSRGARIMHIARAGWQLVHISTAPGA